MSILEDAAAILDAEARLEPRFQNANTTIRHKQSIRVSQALLELARAARAEMEARNRAIGSPDQEPWIAWQAARNILDTTIEQIEKQS